MPPIINEKVAVAPMLDWTNRHFRYFARQLSPNISLYSEMIVDQAIIHGDFDKLLAYDQTELPLIAQLGGSNPQTLAVAAQKCQEFGYTEINLNVGCPSAKVSTGNFGACLMANPQLVAQCIRAMQDKVSIPVTIKHRLGLGYDYNYNYLCDFIGYISQAGCKKFIIHARNAILDGLSPKQNRQVPPLNYEFVYQIKHDFPQLTIMLNGGIDSIEQVDQHLTIVDSVMIGRAAYYNPYILAEIDQKLYPNSSIKLPTRKQIASNMIEYLAKMLNNGDKLHNITRHMIGLYHGCPNARIWRQTLTTKIIHSNSLKDYIQLVESMPE